MASWASVARTEGVAGVAETGLEVKDGERVAVVDANAIISGLHLEGLAQKYVTIPEVIAEIRDKQARQFLSMLPYALHTLEPTEESTKFVLRFARETGDVHSLSSNDVKLLALAHTLELRQHGDKHIREHPLQVRTRSKHRRGTKALPGWGAVANPEDWKVVDAVPENVLASGKGKSRVNADVQALDLPEPAPGAAQLFGQLADAAAPGAADALASSFAAAVSVAPSALGGVLAPAASAASQAPELAGSGQQQAAGAQGHDDDEEDDEEDDDGWAVAGKSRNAYRRKERRERRRAVWQGGEQEQAQPEEAEAPAAAAAAAASSAPQAGGSSSSAPAAAGTSAPAAAAAAQQGQGQAQAQAADEASGSCSDEDDDGDEDEDEDEDGFYMPPDGEEGEEGSGTGTGEEDDEDEDDEDEDDEDEDDEVEVGCSEDPTATADTETAASTACGTDAGSALLLNTDSSVLSVTADFAMQNVVMQMGLRLVTRDGRQITRLSRWALRCTGCFFVTKEAGRVFCPKCGNMTLDKVEVNVGPDGAELFGVRRKHVLKGTVYSLPKPRGGRGARNPILSEDVLMMRMKGKSLRKKDKEAMALDPFAPEYGTETWHQAQQTRIAIQTGQLIITSWKNNPNERKPQRSSRRK